MIQAKISKNETSININRSLADIMTDITVLMRSIYNGLCEEARDDFEHNLKSIIEARLYAVTEEQLDKASRKIEEAMKDKEDFLRALKNGDDDDFIAYLKDILK